MQTQYSRERSRKSLKRSWIVDYDPRIFFDPFDEKSKEALLEAREPYLPGTEEYDANPEAAQSFRGRQRKYALSKFPAQAMADEISRERGFNYPFAQLLWEWLFFNCNLPKSVYLKMIDIYVKSLVYSERIGDGKAPDPDVVLCHIQNSTEPYAIREMPWCNGGAV